MSDEAWVTTFEDEERANRTVRWLRRSGLHARVEQTTDGFAVFVPPGPEEEEARRLLQVLERTRTRIDLPGATGWKRARRRLLNLESLGLVLLVVGGGLFLLIAGIGLWAMAREMGLLALAVVLLAGLVYFHFSGLPHSAVKAPRSFSHKHDITMEEEQAVQYRLAWARDQWRRSRESRFRRRRRKE